MKNYNSTRSWWLTLVALIVLPGLHALESVEKLSTIVFQSGFLPDQLGEKLPAILSGQQGFNFLIEGGEITPDGRLEMLLTLDVKAVDQLWFACGDEFQSDTFDRIVWRPVPEFIAVPAVDSSWVGLDLGFVHNTGKLNHSVLLNSFDSKHHISIRILTDYVVLSNLLAPKVIVGATNQEFEVRFGVGCSTFDTQTQKLVARATVLSEPVWIKMSAGKARVVAYSNFGNRVPAAEFGLFGPPFLLGH